jgi:hypothetical protein
MFNKRCQNGNAFFSGNLEISGLSLSHRLAIERRPKSCGKPTIAVNHSFLFDQSGFSLP